MEGSGWEKQRAAGRGSQGARPDGSPPSVWTRLSRDLVGRITRRLGGYVALWRVCIAWTRSRVKFAGKDFRKHKDVAL